MKVDGPHVIDLVGLARNREERKPAWGLQTEDLNLNLVVLDAAGGVAQHTNNEVDVLLVGIDGEGCVEIDGESVTVGPGQAIVVPKGSSRSIRCIADHFAYLSCHRRRAGLWPDGVPRPSSVQP
jgi:quercetin dioxygenase-like cupin family protein